MQKRAPPSDEQYAARLLSSSSGSFWWCERVFSLTHSIARTTPIQAYVVVKFPECSSGDLEFSKSGDNRWDISWIFVKCLGSNKPSFTFEGSHEYYCKIQSRGTNTPVVKLTVDGARNQNL